MDEGHVVSALDGIVRSTDNMIANLLWVFALLLVLLIVFMLWNIFSQAVGGLGRRASDLFLTVRTNPPLPGSHLRSLGLRTATLYTTSPLQKGASVEFDASSLPNFPQKDLVLSARVSAVSPVRGSDIYLTKINFSRPQHAVVESLRGYIRQLAKSPSRN